jgi:hypothetical protein
MWRRKLLLWMFASYANAALATKPLQTNVDAAPIN